MEGNLVSTGMGVPAYRSKEADRSFKMWALLVAGGLEPMGTSQRVAGRFWVPESGPGGVKTQRAGLKMKLGRGRQASVGGSLDLAIGTIGQRGPICSPRKPIFPPGAALQHAAPRPTKRRSVYMSGGHGPSEIWVSN